MKHFEAAPQPINSEERNIPEKQEDNKGNFEHFSEEQFGEEEVPKEIIERFEEIQESLIHYGRETRFLGEEDPVFEKALTEFETFAIETVLYKEGARDLDIVAVPEKGVTVKYTDKNDRTIEKEFDKAEHDFFFNMEIYADGIREYGNAKNFSNYITAIFEKYKKEDKIGPTKQEANALIEEVYNEYHQFGFSRQEIADLILVADKEGVSFFEKAGIAPEEKRQELLKTFVTNTLVGKDRAEIFEKYLTDQQRGKFYKMGAALMGIGALEGFSPHFISKAVSGSSDIKEAVFYALSAVALAGIGGFGKQKLNNMLDQYINEVMKSGLTKKISREISYLPGEKIGGDPSKVLRTAERSQEGLNRLLKDYAIINIPAIGTIITAAAQLAVKSPLLAIGTAASAPLGAMLYSWVNEKQGKLIDKAYEKQDEQTKEILKQLGAHFDTAMTGQKEKMAERLEELTHQAMEIAHEKEHLITDANFYSGMISSGTMAAISVLAKVTESMGIQIPEKAMNAIITAQLLSGNLDITLRSNMGALGYIKSMVEMEEIFNNYYYKEIVGDESRVPVEDLPNMGIELKNLSMKFNNRELLQKLNLGIKPGDFVSLQGFNGHGKSTLLKILSGYYKPTGGSVEIGGVNVQNIKKGGKHALSSRMIFLEQDPFIHPDSVAKNIAAGYPDAAKEEIGEVVKEVGLDYMLEKGQIGLDDKIDATRFSGGEKRRLAIARMLIRMRHQDTGIVIMDEPTNDLDTQARRLLLDIIRKEKTKKPDTIFLVISHEKDFMREVEKIVGNVRTILVQDGGITETTHQEQQ
ncbi:MAG: hypothetical protein A3F54_04475 [Candidatus Kerfeldbacteria bacterium RIFCSPHIGHO2_12_FULL_48_17]|uniref:ABC transporter domain-containing protein n=1 Tax=Candidatus Kerfeldbacteria bacterium RIFCSPHIGHO2_12_FULL_48_17 TaxID=1798542 RepID=A0A1G2B2X2_9BACT|nr:MAG: hypothetical protein A3F54_04475 [Candidatus Kerfeldbacteria bacterium RIFCSPHIGHO2_12_FULL_48_17]